jgi:heme/copper-type cytochrome/quinol oxidase subunit 2
MSAIKKLIVFVLVIAVVIVLERAWLNAIQPDVSKQLAIAQVNGDDAALRNLRLFEGYKDGANIVVVFVILCAAWLLASRPRIRREKNSHRNPPWPHDPPIRVGWMRATI